MALGHRIESLRFWDVVSLWARERMDHEEVVARALAAAVIRDGLMIYSTDPKGLRGRDGRLELRGTPYVGYCACGSGEVTILRAQALEHLLRVVRTGSPPTRNALAEEFVFRSDFARWLVWSGEDWPQFWFSRGEERVGA